MATQAILSAIAEFIPSDARATLGMNNSTISPSLPSNASSPPQLDTAPNLSFLSIPTLLFSFAARNQDVLKLFIIGGLIETFRRFSERIWAWFLNSFFLTAYFDQTDDTFGWMMVWLAKQSVWAKAREVHISTASWGQTHHKGIEIPGLHGDSTDMEDTGFQTKRKLAYLPAFDTTHWLRYRGTWMSVCRHKSEARDAWSRKEETIEISLFTRDHRILRSLLQDAKRVYKAEDQDTVDIYGADTYNDWYRTSTRKKRPLQSIVLEPEIKNLVLDDAKDFLSNEKWYTDRGIPYRRGYLLHGVPGSGKTSLIHSVAGELGLDIYVVSLAKKSLDDTSLNELICALPTRSIALIEDIDAAFHHAATAREGISGSSGAGSAPETTPPVAPGARQETETKGVTLSGLLGALDGVAAQEGRILFATTNRYEALDEALRRPGRMDVHIEFKKATSWQARELFRCFFPPFDDEQRQTVAPEKPQDSGGQPTAYLTQAESDSLAEQFSEAIPADTFSMASLQGYLMRHKERPYEAVKTTREWVEKELQNRTKQQ